MRTAKTDQTGQMPRLIWVFTGRTVILLALSCRGSFYIWAAAWLTMPTKWFMCLAKTLIRLGRCPGWLESLLCALCMGSQEPKASSCGQGRLWWVWADPRLIWIFAGHTGHFVGFVVLWHILGCGVGLHLSPTPGEWVGAQICELNATYKFCKTLVLGFSSLPSSIKSNKSLKKVKSITFNCNKRKRDSLV